MTLSAAAGADLEQHADGLAIYMGVMPAQLLRGNADASHLATMHGGLPSGSGSHHLVIAIYDERTQRQMIAKDVMTTAVVTVKAQTSIEDVARLLLKCRISAVPVVDAKGRIQGIVSEGDLIRRVEAGTESHRSWWLDILANRDRIALDYVKSHARTAGDVTTREVITVGKRTPLAKIATLLERHRIKRVPVVRTGKVVGIVSRANLLHGLVAQKTAGAKASVSDRDIRSRILKEFGKAGVDKLYVNIVVTSGEAEFRGVVESEAQNRALRVAAENVKGVKRIVSNVTVLSMKARASMGAQ